MIESIAIAKAIGRDPVRLAGSTYGRRSLEILECRLGIEPAQFDEISKCRLSQHDGSEGDLSA